MIFKLSSVMAINAWKEMLNILKRHFWDQIPIETAIDMYYRTIHELYYDTRIEQDITPETAKIIGEEFIKRTKEDCSFIYERAKGGGRNPFYRNFKQFAKKEKLPFHTKKEMQAFISKNF